MSDYIKREDVLSILNEARKEWKPEIGVGRGEYLRIRYKNLPAADVRENVRGEWISSGDEHQVCSVCGYCPEITIIEKLDENQKLLSRIGCVKLTNFCSNCGTDMRGGNDGLSRAGKELA